MQAECTLICSTYRCSTASLGPRANGRENVQRTICNGKTNPVKDLVDFAALEYSVQMPQVLAADAFSLLHSWPTCRFSSFSQWSGIQQPRCTSASTQAGIFFSVSTLFPSYKTALALPDEQSEYSICRFAGTISKTGSFYINRICPGFRGGKQYYLEFSSFN